MSSGVPARLDRPIELVVDVVLPIEEARELLQQAVERKVSIEESGNETGREVEPAADTHAHLAVPHPVKAAALLPRRRRTSGPRGMAMQGTIELAAHVFVLPAYSPSY
jgi:hypothetical protein